MPSGQASVAASSLEWDREVLGDLRPGRKSRGRIWAECATKVIEHRKDFPGFPGAERAREMASMYAQEGQSWPLQDRLLFLEALGRLDGQDGDPRLAKPGYLWVRIEPGATDLDAKKVKVAPAFELAWAPVTVQEHARFVAACAAASMVERAAWWGKTPEPESRCVDQAAADSWRNQVAHPNWPVVNVSWYEAMAHCRWRTARSAGKWTYLLPTEAEWQWAAEGEERREYPWGREEPGKGDAAQANWREASIGHPTPVGAFPAGNRDGLVDLAGNVWEWCANEFDERKACRGGSWGDGGPQALRCRDRLRIGPHNRGDDLGFRVVRAAGTLGA